jgi:3-dehydroquinate synthase/2-deoxy-scyllo-inosose synthase
MPPPIVWQHVDISVGSERYPYWYGHDCLDAIAEHLHAMSADRFLVVSDDKVLALHGDGLLSRLTAIAPTHILGGAAGERLKSMSTLASHAETAVAVGATRRTVVVAFGGGTVGNLAGLLAAMLFRGIRLVHVPTTLVASMDSVISLKQAINSSRGKNHFGVYHRPSAVLTDVRLLQTLPARERRSGLCEAIKNCLAIRPIAIQRLHDTMLVTDPDDAAALVWLLGESVAAKTSVMHNDPRERLSGLVLEYGHTVGHAIELHDHQARGPESLSHGEAVGLGMIAAARLSRQRGW